MKTGVVAHFLPHFPGREGTTAFCRGLCGALNTANPGSSQIWSYKEQAREAKEPVVGFSGPRRHAFDLPTALKAKVSSVDGLSGVVLHGAFNPPMAAMGRYLRKLGIPYIFMPHDPYANELMSHGRLKKAVYWRFFERYLLEKSAGVILLSEDHEESLRRRGYNGRVVTIPNGCDPNTQLFQRIDKSADEPFTIQYLGRMDRNHKGLDLLIEGFTIFFRGLKTKRVRLILSGNDWFDRSDLEGRVRSLGMQEHIIFTGARSESSAEIFSSADLAVLTSRFDGFGLTIVEAMLAACPVLVTDTCGVASHVRKGGGGYTVPPSVEGIAGGFELAWNERDRWSDIGWQARDFVLRELTWQQAARKSNLIYQEWFGSSDEGKVS